MVTISITAIAKSKGKPFPNMEKRKVTLSVHGLVDTLLRRGDIDSRIYNTETMRMGTLLHAGYQKKQGKEYLAEVPLSGTFEREEAIVTVEGRADGIVVGGPCPLIDEIKSTVSDLDAFYEEQKEWHLGQAKVYAFLYLKGHGGERAEVQLTYISQIEDKRKTHRFQYDFSELESYFYELLDRFLKRQKEVFLHLEMRRESAKTASFPFEDFRKGQREIAKYVFGTAKSGGFLFCEAPTGIGKTISTLYPAYKSFSHTSIAKIFYLTAKGSGKRSAESALMAMREKGAVLYSSSLSSKESICLSKGSECNPDSCPFARRYYDKFEEARREMLDSCVHFGESEILRAAEKYQICPFEFELDMSYDSDVIVADYNYFIDPFSHLERYFDDKETAKDMFLIVDESHNLIDRARKCYSASISLVEMKAAKKSLKAVHSKKLSLRVSKLMKAMEEALSVCPSATVLADFPLEIEKTLTKLLDAKKELQKEPDCPSFPSEFKEFTRDAYRLLSLLDEERGYRSFLTPYVRPERKEMGLFCPDPSLLLCNDFQKVRGAVFVSGTLSPIDYYSESIVGSSKEPFLLLPSPFPAKNFKMLVAPLLSTRYKDRTKTIDDVVLYLKAFVEGKTGNYFIFAPSFEYLHLLEGRLSFEGNVRCFYQSEGMEPREREEFLSHFIPSPSQTNVGVLVIGGSFGEGIDLPDDRLIGVAVIGVGLPQIGFETETLRDFFDRKNGEGFAFAYRNPGINKVMQAVGRLIRSERDKGIALLLDDRYTKEEYSSILKKRYPTYEIVTKPEDIEEAEKAFYKENR